MEQIPESELNTNRTPVGAAMVVGGGVAGIQAALDLANSGIKVYLVESSSAIGGKMAQLDKTFPTNDCAMCTISPRLVECSRHRNIEIITDAEVAELKGSAGDFTAIVRRKPRYIDLAKCTGCGDCVAKCPVKVESRYDAGLGDRTAIYKLYPQAVPSAVCIDKKGRAPCKDACPAGCSAEGYIALLGEGRYQEAIDVVRDTIPFASVCGRVCRAFCEDQCRRAQVDEPLAISSLKRFLVDWEFSQGGPKGVPVERTRDERVAIVGAGPAGLTAARDLAIKGYGVSVFEALPVPGGMMRVGIPAFRLSREQLDAEISAIVGLGIDLKLGHKVESAEALFGDGYSAVFVAVGAHAGDRLSIPGADLPGVHVGTEFLRRAALGEEMPTGHRLLVVGGGNVAMDCARTALRLGFKEVSVVYRRTRAEMPALAEEIDDAEKEGIKFQFLTNPTKVVAENGRAAGLEVQRMELGEPDASGRRRPIPVAGSESVMPGDVVIFAIGQSPELGLLAGSGVAVTPQGTIEVNPATLATSRTGLFAGGDAVTGTTWIVDAIAAGHKAAKSIDAFINGEPLEAPMEDKTPVVSEPVDVEGIERSPRQRLASMVGAPGSLTMDKELKAGFSEEQARAEADRCLQCGVCSECYVCERVCQAGAICHDQQESFQELRIGAVIAAPGYEVFDAAKADEFGFGRYPNVLTSLQFERLLSASGPTSGHVVRPSDHVEPKKVAWLQCIGSRDQEHPYCSSVCCMYATKQAMLAKDHVRDVECTIFQMDMRAFGKGFDAYVERAKEQGVRYVYCRPSMIKEVPSSRNLIVRHYTEDGGLVEEEFDMVVMSVGMAPGEHTEQLAKTLGVSLNQSGFCATETHRPLDTSTDGVFACGPFVEPMDIPDSVTQASGAAARALEILAPARGQLVSEKVYPPERVVEQEPRVGVFVCHCGSNIAGVVDVEAVREDASKLPGVVYTERNLYTCSQDTQEKIKQAIEEHGLNRIVVASCSPRTHEPLFQDTIREVGVNPYLFEMANIRDQCSWVHGREPEAATEKAKDLVHMAVARARTLQPLHRQDVPVTQAALVIGAGVAGMTAALSLAHQGNKVYLIERAERPGGLLQERRYGLRGEDTPGFLRSLVAQVLDDSRIEVLTDTTVVRTSGFVGSFQTTVETDGRERTLEHGVTIVATGARELREPRYLLGQDDRVVTHGDLEQLIADGSEVVSKAKTVVMIQCVGRDREGAGYCSRICCAIGMKNALKLKEVNPDAQVYVLFRDVRTYGFQEELYTEARRRGVLFLRYDEESKPRVEERNGRLMVTARDEALGEDMDIAADMVVLAEALAPSEGADSLAVTLKLPLTREGFFLEAHPKLRPVDFSSEGIFLCGAAHYPKLTSECISQALGAAARAATILAKPYLEVGGAVAQVNPDLCAACLTCVRVCPYHVPRINENNVAEINVAACQGCGTCAGECPAKAIDLLNYRDEQVNAKSDALLTGV